MRVLFSILLAVRIVFVGGNSDAGESAPVTANAPARLALRDQFGALQVLAFPRTNTTLLTIADRRGAEQIAGWIAPVQRRFGTRIEICGIADLSAVPRPLHPMVRRQFQKSQDHPVMLDWSGDAVKTFQYVPGNSTLLVFDGRGRILLRVNGEANEAAVREVCDAIDRALAAGPSTGAVP